MTLLLVVSNISPDGYSLLGMISVSADIVEAAVRILDSFAFLEAGGEEGSCQFQVDEGWVLVDKVLVL